MPGQLWRAGAPARRGVAEMGHSQGGREKWVPRHGAGSPGLNGWLRVRRSDPLRKARVDSAALPTAHSVSASRPTAALCPRSAPSPGRGSALMSAMPSFLKLQPSHPELHPPTLGGFCSHSTCHLFMLQVMFSYCYTLYNTNLLSIII